MASTEKVSIALSAEELEWAREQAELQQRSVSAIVSEAVRLSRQHAARRAVLEYLGDAGHVTEDEAAAIAAEWR